MGRRARAESRPPRGAADQRRHRRDGRDQLRPPPAGGSARPLADPRAGDVGAARSRRWKPPARASRGGTQLHADRRRAGGPHPEPRHGITDRRVAADPQPWHRRRQPRHGLPRRRRPPAAAGDPRRRRARGSERTAARADRRVLRRPEAQRPRSRRADPRRPHPGRRRTSAVLQDRSAQRDGHRHDVVRAVRRPWRPAHRHGHRVGWADTSAGARGRGADHRRDRRAVG